MRQRKWTAGGIAGGTLLALAAPVVLSVVAAQRDAEAKVLSRARIYAGEVLHRSDATTDQVEAAVDRLRLLPGDPCGQAHVALMREIDLSSSYIQAIGHTTGTRLTCSSLSAPAAVDLGPPQLTSPIGALVRVDVKITPGDPTSYVVVEHHGYAVIVHKKLPLDIANQDASLSLATVVLPTGTVLTSRGSIKGGWGGQGVEGGTVSFVDRSRAVAVAGSSRWHIAAVAAFAPSVLKAETRASYLRFVPVGALVGLVLATSLVLLARRRLTLVSELRAGLRRGELYLDYQPVIELSTGRLAGAEALLRWRHPDGRLVRPDLFIPVAEEAGLMSQVTRRVIELVRADWDALVNGRPGFHVALNISAQDVDDDDLVEELCRLRELGPGSVILEITERGMLDHERAAKVFARLRACGLEVAVDDFGTGYSSLSYLESFPLDYLKIDKSFVDSLGVGAATSNVAVHIIEMARALDLRIVAEGVERPEQATFLRERGVQLAQGWLFGRPGTVEDLGPAGVTSGHEGAVQHS